MRPYGATAARKERKKGKPVVGSINVCGVC